MLPPRLSWCLAVVLAAVVLAAGPAEVGGGLRAQTPTSPPVRRPAEPPAEAKPPAETKAPAETKPAANKPQEPTLAPVMIREYGEPAVRAAFAAIDGDADDRISIFEWLRAQVQPNRTRDTELFRLMDADGNGFALWPEFDERVRQALRLVGEFRYQPARSIKPAVAKATPAPTRVRGAVTVLIEMADTDRSNGLSRDEYAAMLQASGLPAANAVHFIEADKNRTGELDERELAVLLTLVPELAQRVEAAPAAKGLSEAWARADRDADGEISAAELASALRRIEPHLSRWATKLVADADRNGDRRLGPAEILASEVPRKR